MLQIVEKVSKAFWEKWNEEIRDFPDTEDAKFLEHWSLEASMNTIIGNYLLGFPKEKRAHYLDHLIMQFRAMGYTIRDLDVEEI